MRSLSTTSVASFWDELEKIAVSIDDLYRSASKAKNVFIGDVPETVQGGGAITVPKRDVALEVIDRRAAPVREGFSKVRSGLSEILPGSRLMGALRENLVGRLDNAEGAYNKMILSQKRDVRKKGVIAVNPTLSGKIFGVPDSSSRGLTASLLAHELYERGVKKKNLNLLYSHLAPEVLLKEHNLLSRLTGDGSDEVRSAFRKVRQTTGEAPHMKALLTSVYGPRAAQFTEEGAKIPMSMVRDLQKKLQADPSLVAKAKASVPQGSLLDQGRSYLDKARLNLRALRATSAESARLMNASQTPNK